MSQWFHAQDGRQHGPVDEAELRQLVASGRLKPDDLVWRDGMPEWVPVSSLPQLAPSPGPSMAPPPPAPSNPYQAPMTPASFASRAGGNVDVGEALSLGWQAFSANFAIGTLAALIYFAITLVTGFIPIVSIVAPILVGTPLLAGLLYCGVLAVDHARGSQRPIVIDDLFSTFRVNYGHAVLYGLLWTIAVLAGVVVLGIGAAVMVPQLEDQPALIVLAVLVMLVPLVYLSLRLFFGYQYLADKRATAIEAFSSSWQATRGQVLPLLGLAFLITCIYLAGTLLLLVGVVPAMFLAACIAGAAFRQVAGD